MIKQPFFITKEIVEDFKIDVKKKKELDETVKILHIFIEENSYKMKDITIRYD